MLKINKFSFAQVQLKQGSSHPKTALNRGVGFTPLSEG